MGLFVGLLIFHGILVSNPVVSLAVNEIDSGS